MHRDKSYYKLIEVLGRSEKKITYLSEVGLSSFLPDEDFLAITESGNIDATVAEYSGITKGKRDDIFALLVYVFSQLSAAPVTLHCEGKVQLNGSYGFTLQPIITDLLKDPSCEVQLITENTVRAIYEKGNVPAYLSSPVLKATMHHFTLSNCPNSVTLDVDCPHRQKVPRTVHCHCSVQSITSTSTPLTSVSKADNTNSVVSGVAIGLGLGLVGVAAIAIAITWFIFKHSKKRNDVFMKKNNRGTSASSSTDELGAANMMLRHDDQA
ncbi:uncharacterized protein LOC105901679 isoform X2 [Clupea harengus]|uniref:Uncharacterized protein LOC105901679 isoform X2 n=1 Tax=Clupea harengus TaxID=7950 RepID=A0A6P8FX24_CLUHA|nr:uncharacterized protein LOC105901679 isoform X2 [Clupea harengus]